MDSSRRSTIDIVHEALGLAQLAFSDCTDDLGQPIIRASLKGPSSLAWDVPWDLTICPQLTRFYDVTCQSCIAADDWRCGPRAEVQALGELIQERRLVSRSHVEYSGRTGAAWVALRNESVPEAAGTTPAARVVVGHLGRRLADLVARFTPLHAAFVRVVLGRIPAAAALDQSLKPVLEAARSALEARAVAEAAATLLGAGIRHARVAVSNTGGGTALIWDVQCDTAGRVFTHEVLNHSVSVQVPPDLAGASLTPASGKIRGRMRSWADFRVPPCRAEALAAAVSAVNDADLGAAAGAEVTGSFGLDSGVGGYLCFKVEFVCSAASGSEGGGGSTATLRRLVSRAYGLAHGRVARFSAAFRAIIEGASAAEALSGLLPLRAALLPSLATCPAHRLSSSTVYSAAGGRIFRGVPQTDAADPLPVHWRPGSAATLPTTMTVAAAGGPLTSPPPPPPQALALLPDGTDDGTGSSGGGDAKAPEVASFAGKAFRLLAKHGRFDNLAAAAAAELLVAAARAAAAATAGTAPATALLLAGGGGAPQASSSSSSSHGLLGLGAAAVPVAARLAAIVREALASLGIGRVEAAGPRALRFAVRFDTPAVPAEQRAAGPGGRLAADAGLVAHCDVRWADSGLCSGGPRLRLRVYGGERSCTPDLAAAALSAPPGVAALACFLARANCSLAYGAWQWDPLAAASSAAGAPASAPPSSNAPAFCADVRFRPEEAGAACVARCAAAFKVALETWERYAPGLALVMALPLEAAGGEEAACAEVLRAEAQ